MLNISPLKKFSSYFEVFCVLFLSRAPTYGAGMGAVGTMQSIGAAGLGAAGTIVAGAGGAAAGKIVKDTVTGKKKKDE